MGAFLFAWAASGNTPFSESEHGVDGEDVFFVELRHAEGEFPTLTVEIKNPRVGLLNPYRDQWAYLSWEESDAITPVFFGRLLGVPNDLQGEIIRLSFIARPPDFEDQKAALAESLKIAPYYDPIWINADKLDDPDSVLEGYNALWHIDRVTHEVTISDNLRGEDGTKEIGIDDAFYDDLNMAIGASPLARVNVNGQVRWNQAAAGLLDITDRIVAAFAAVGASPAAHLIASLTGEGLSRTWPEKGKSIGGGWSVGDSSISVLSGTAINADYKSVNITPLAETVVRTPGMTDAEFAAALATALADASANPVREARFYRWIMRPAMAVDYAASRERSETISFSLEADVQSVLFDEIGKSADINLASNSIVLPLDLEDLSGPGSTASASEGALPIGDIRRKQYFNTDRGKRSLETLICFARAKLLLSARAVDVSTRAPIDLGFDLSCRRDARITDDRLPGGEAAGKISSYVIVMNPQSGEAYTEINIACTIGRGDTLGAANPGTPTYVEEGYVEPGYQLYAGASIIPIAGEVSYDDFQLPIVDDGIDLFNLRADDVIASLVVSNGEAAQETVLSAGFSSVQDAIAALNEAHTEVTLQMVPLIAGPFETLYPVTVSKLMIPKTIDLEAEAV
jgi:hypothetical protein